MTDLSDLIARLEAAEEGSRELDREIHLAVIGDEAVAYDHGGWDAGVVKKITPEGPVPWEVKIYTTSIDAALQLVPEGLWWVLNSGVQTGTAFCQVGGGKGWSDRTEAHGSTSALALCAAALKARASSDTGVE